MNYKWCYLPPTSDVDEEAERLSHELGMSPVVCRLLVERGIRSYEEAKKFFRPSLNQLHDPFLMDGMKDAVDRINLALGRKERIMVYGDYDVDGTTAVTLVYKFLGRFTSNICYYIPNRYEDGYGVTDAGVDYAREQGVKLVIVLDCGVKAVREITRAKKLGIDFIVCDHHMQDDELPPAVAILNPKLIGSHYPYPHLSGCGVGFKLMQAFAMNNGMEFSQLTPYLDLVAVSIASDIVPIMGENRILAYHGLRQLNHSPSTGLKAIIQVCGLKDKELKINDLIFRIGPRINASGRIQTGMEAVDLLAENDFRKALALAKHIDEYNETRKDLDKAMTEEANVIVDSLENFEDKHSIVLYNEDWHRGIIGIVASRLSELFIRPSVVLTKCNDLATGSARSVSDFDVYKAIESCRDLLDNFGGHPYAAGLSMKVENVPEFKRRFEKYVSEHIEPMQMEPLMHIDAEIPFREITMKLYNDLKKFEPFGPDNQKPVFCTRRVFDYGTSKVVGRNQEHIKLEMVDNDSLRVMNGIAFGQSQQVRYIKSKHSFDICYTLEENTHKRGEVQLQISSIRPSTDEQ
ncbi:MAG: single-stranded-DNA-specific exonuclease RecJ [Bacteroidaceae bacterium]|nr:single-stranded-DNA-specific exonuclease RecJ [Bacteroidaceae bacterium]